MEDPRPLLVCTNVCIIFAHTGAGILERFYSGLDIILLKSQLRWILISRPFRYTILVRLSLFYLSILLVGCGMCH